MCKHFDRADVNQNIAVVIFKPDGSVLKTFGDVSPVLQEPRLRETEMASIQAALIP